MYMQVVRLLQQNDDSQLRVLYRALSDCVVDVDVERLPELKDAIVKFNWAAEKRTCEAFISFTLCLCSAHRNAVPLVLEMLAKQFRPVIVRVPDAVDPSLLVPSVDEISSALVSSRALETLKEVVALVPTCTHTLQETLIRLIPHRRSLLPVLTGYTACLLRVAAFAVALRPALIKACVDLLLVLDVEIRIDDVQFSPPVPASAADLQFDLDDPASTTAVAAAAAATAVVAGARGARGIAPSATLVADANVRLVRESADKLDALMLLMFEDISTHCGAQSDAGESELGIATRRGLLESFAASVLTTSRCKFVQFLAFYCASLGGDFCANLLDMLLRKLADVNEAPMTRQCAAHYVGSLVSRARFVTPALRHQALVSLARYARHYLDGVSPQAQRPSAPMHAVLYATVQALLYGICFAYDDYSVAVAQAASVALGLDDGRRGGGGGGEAASASDDGALWPLAEFELEHILAHDTMPLKFCAASVVDEFARLAPSLGLPVVVQLLRRQRRYTLPIDAHWTDANQPLFFPFDPYMLRLSSSFVDRDEIYAHFTMPTVIETNAIAAFAPHHAAAFDAAAAALADEAEAEAEADDDDLSDLIERRPRPLHLRRRERRRSRSPHSSLSGSSIGTPTREVLHSLGHSGSGSFQAHHLGSSLDRMSFADQR